MAMCADMGVGLVPYSPQGKGHLARPWGQQSVRSTVDKVVKSFDSPLDEPVVKAVQRVAEARHVPMAHVALARAEADDDGSARRPALADPGRRRHHSRRAGPRRK